MAVRQEAIELFVGLHGFFEKWPWSNSHNTKPTHDSTKARPMFLVLVWFYRKPL